MRPGASDQDRPKDREAACFYKASSCKKVLPSTPPWEPMGRLFYVYLISRRGFTPFAPGLGDGQDSFLPHHNVVRRLQGFQQPDLGLICSTASAYARKVSEKV